MTSITISRGDLLNKILYGLSLDINTFWEHENFLGHVSACDIMCHHKTFGDEIVYHFSTTKNIHKVYYDDVILAVNYATKTVALLCPPRPLMGYCSPPDEDILVKWPVRDGTVLKLLCVHGEWHMSSKGSLDISDKAFFDVSFRDILEELIGDNLDNVFDKQKSYIVSMTSKHNCLHKDTVEGYSILEDISVNTDGDFVINLRDETPIAGTESYNFGTVYRTVDGVYIDTTQQYKDISKILYSTNNHRIDALSRSAGISIGQARKLYIITRAILTGHDDMFGETYPSLKETYNQVRNFVNTTCKIIDSQCLSSIKNPKYSNTFIGNMVSHIGPLKTSHGIHIVRDCVYSINNVEVVAAEFIKFNKK